MVVSGSYDSFIVALSIAVAIFASFTALNLADRLVQAEGHARQWWLLIAALALGGGIWSMHFIGMLAFNTPMPVSYDVRLTVASFLLPILATGFGLHIVGRSEAAWRPILAGGLFVGLGIAVMHYTGMGGMQAPGMVTSYNPVLVGASLAIAISAATAGLWLAFRRAAKSHRSAAAAIMGLAISGMHYTGMAAARFTITDHVIPHPGGVIQSDALALTVAGATLFLLLISLQAAYFDRTLAKLSAREAEALKFSETRHRSLIENSSDIIAIVDQTGRIAYESSSARHVLGYQTEHLIGRSIHDFVAPRSLIEMQALLSELTAQPGARASAEISLLRQDGGQRDFRVVGQNLIGEPSVGGLVLNLRDITERKQLMVRLETLSVTDALTGALNRRGFVEIAEREMDRQRRTGEPLSLIIIDLDRFKEVNDNYGHAAGDLVLAMVSGECRKQIRSADILARIGGEEFVILLPDTTTDTAYEIAGRLREAIAGTSVTTIKGRVSVTASMGLATITASTPDLDAALRSADEALYAAKNAGRNCIEVRANGAGGGSF